MIWPSVPLEKLARISGGSTPKRNNDAFWNGDVPWVTPTDLPEPGASIADVEDTKDHITQEGFNSCSAPRLPPETVLFSSRATIGKIGIAKVPLATNQGFTNLTPNPGVEPKYLAYALRHFTPQITALAGSTTFKEVSRGSMRNFQIPLPPPSEQRQIVKVLDQADAIQCKQADVEEKARRILPALFMKMFGNPATNPLRWEVRTLGDLIFETQYGISIKANADESGIPILRMNNIDIRGQLHLSNLKHVNLNPRVRHKHMLEPGDILFNRTNSKELVGKTGLWRGQIEAVLASYMIRIRVDLKQVLPEFVWAYMNTRFMKQIIFNRARQAIGMANINAKELRSFPAFVPELQLQQEFADKIGNIEEHIIASECARDAQVRVRRVLMHRAFSGELTVKWRDSRVDALLHEAEEQAEALETAFAQDSTTRRARTRGGQRHVDSASPRQL